MICKNCKAVESEQDFICVTCYADLKDRYTDAMLLVKEARDTIRKRNLQIANLRKEVKYWQDSCNIAVKAGNSIADERDELGKNA